MNTDGTMKRQTKASSVATTPVQRLGVLVAYLIQPCQL